MLTAKTPVVTSGDINVREASHWSKVPFIATDAFTLNAIELSAWVIAKTGASCARLTDGSTAEANRQRATNRMPGGMSFLCFIGFSYCAAAASSATPGQG